MIQRLAIKSQRPLMRKPVAGTRRATAPAIAALATLLSAYSCEQALDNFLQIVPCVMG